MKLIHKEKTEFYIFKSSYGLLILFFCKYLFVNKKF
jgi:hypothetical protein